MFISAVSSELVYA